MKRRDVIEFEVDKMEFGGTSVSRYGNRDIHMKGGITGQKVKAAVKRTKSGKADVKMLELLENSPIETETPCKHFNECGGCSILSVPYEKQLEIKERQVMDLFLQQDLLGLHKKGRHIDIMTVDGCFLVDQDFIKVLTSTVEFFNEKELPYYRTVNHKGYLRNLVVRKGINTNELMVNIVTSSQVDFNMNEYKDMLLNLDTEAELVSILHTINDGLADAVNCDELRVLHGRDYIHEEVLGLRFRVSPFSFFQTNTKGAEELYTIAREFVGIWNRNNRRSCSSCK